MEMFHTSSIKMYYTIFKEINTRVGGLSLCTAQLTSFFFINYTLSRKVTRVGKLSLLVSAVLLRLESDTI